MAKADKHTVEEKAFSKWIVVLSGGNYVSFPIIPYAD
jgi:hypothetical protein